MSDLGVVYVASQDLGFLCEAIASAEALRRVCPGVPITLFTDFVDTDSPLPPFDRVIKTGDILPPAAASLWPWAIGLYAKVIGMARSPYPLTVYLDTDTRVRRREFLELGECLRDHTLALVACSAKNSRSCQLYGPMFNSGMIAYRRDEHSDRLFRDWAALQQGHLDLAVADDPAKVPYLAHLGIEDRRFLLVNDQTSLARLVSPGRNEYGMSVKELPDRWNARNLPRYRLQGVVVDHAARHKIDGQRVGPFLASRRLDFLHDASRAQRRRHRWLPWSLASRLIGALTLRTKNQ